MEYERELIPLARLRLNNENDRHGPLLSEHECLQWLLTHYRGPMINLAKNIAEHGLSPIDRHPGVALRRENTRGL